MGVFIGSPDTHVSVSNSLNQKLVDAQAKMDGLGAAPLTDAQKAEIQKKVNDQIHAKRKKIEDEVGKYNVIPALMVGVTYRF